MVKEPHHHLNADEVRRQCIRHDCLERDLARLLCLDPTNFSKYINGHRRMGENQIAVMAAFFDVPWKTLVVDRKPKVATKRQDVTDG